MEATRQFNLDMNRALDISRDDLEREHLRQKAARDAQRRALPPSANPEFNDSLLLRILNTSDKFLKWAAVNPGKALITSCLELEQLSLKWSEFLSICV